MICLQPSFAISLPSVITVSRLDFPHSVMVAVHHSAFSMAWTARRVDLSSQATTTPEIAMRGWLMWLGVGFR